MLHTSPARDKANFYRIKQVDRDGKVTYTDVRLVRFNSDGILTITPNPASNFIRVYSTQSPVSVRIMDESGRRMDSKILTSGSLEFNISRFARGTYIVIAESNGVRIETKKIVKQ
jgi:hypothetical protein